MPKLSRLTVVAWIGVLATVAGQFTVGQSAAAVELLAGVARVDLTPPLDLKAPLGVMANA